MWSCMSCIWREILNLKFLSYICIIIVQVNCSTFLQYHFFFKYEANFLKINTFWNIIIQNQIKVSTSKASWLRRWCIISKKRCSSWRCWSKETSSCSCTCTKTRRCTCWTFSIGGIIFKSQFLFKKM